jgi:hypothetical protein
MGVEASRWRRCSSCKAPIGFGAVYWVCNVSTCNQKRTGLVFCTVSCWDAHLSVVRHRESWALEKRAPSEPEWRREKAAEAAPAQVVRLSKPAAPARESSPGGPRRIFAASDRPTPPRGEEIPREILIVTSKLKAYVRARSGMSTSDAVLEPLSDAVRRLCDQAVRKAAAAERKTILARDFE